MTKYLLLMIISLLLVACSIVYINGDKELHEGESKGLLKLLP